MKSEVETLYGIPARRMRAAAEWFAGMDIDLSLAILLPKVIASCRVYVFDCTSGRRCPC